LAQVFGKVENTAIVKKVDKSLINTDRFQEAEQIITGSKKIGGGIKAGDQNLWQNKLYLVPTWQLI
jgi:hypothetical protein